MSHTSHVYFSCTILSEMHIHVSERADDDDDSIDHNNDCDVDEDDYDYAYDHHLLHDNSGGTRITGCMLPIATECAGARRKVAT